MAKRRAGRRSKKGYEGWHQRHVNDLRYMLRACCCGRLPEANREYLKHILLNDRQLPKPREIAKRVNFTNAQREQHKLWTIPPVDMTKADLAKQRKEKDKLRKMLARRKAKAQRGRDLRRRLHLSSRAMWRRASCLVRPTSGSMGSIISALIGKFGIRTARKRPVFVARRLFTSARRGDVTDREITSGKAQRAAHLPKGGLRFEHD